MRICGITGKTLQSGNNVSHANNKTRRTFKANIQTKRLFSNVLGYCSFKVTPKGLKTIEAKGGLDAFFSSAKKLFGKAEIFRKRFLKITCPSESSKKNA